MQWNFYNGTKKCKSGAREIEAKKMRETKGVYGTRKNGFALHEKKNRRICAG